MFAIANSFDKIHIINFMTLVWKILDNSREKFEDDDN